MPADVLFPYGKDGSCHGFADIYVTVAQCFLFWKNVLGKDTISSPDAPEALGIMTDALPRRIRKTSCFLL